ncbi:MAG: dephospho-CoA kinase [Anaerolineales bacterium]
MGGREPYLIGLTGNIATGKTTVGRMLVDLGAELIDADKVAHRVMRPGGRAYDRVVDAFGESILNEDGTIDRRALGEIVFNDPPLLVRLESLVHPPTIAAVEERIRESPAPVVVVEAIKLLESGMAERYHALWVTACPPEVQLERLMEGRGLSREDARERIRAQPPQSEKVARADIIIDTGETLEETRAQVLRSWKNRVVPQVPSLSSPF